MPDETQTPGADAAGDAEKPPTDLNSHPAVEFARNLPGSMGGGDAFAGRIRKELEYDKELADKGLDTREELLDYYKELYKEVFAKRRISLSISSRLFTVVRGGWCTIIGVNHPQYNADALIFLYDLLVSLGRRSVSGPGFRSSGSLTPGL